MMSEVPRNSAASLKQNESGPNYFAYYKHLILNLVSRNGNGSIPFMEVDSAVSGKAEGVHTNKNSRSNYFCSGPYFTDSVGEGLSDFKKERLLATLNESAVCFNREADEMLDHILATFKIDSNLREKEQLPSYLNAVSDKDLRMPLNNKKRKARSSKSNSSSSDSTSVKQVYNHIQSLRGKDEINHEDVKKYTSQLHAKLEKMEENLEDYLNIVMSKSRQMTRIEKHRLGKRIRELPEKALERVAEILEPSKFSAKVVPENISVNLENQDNVKLWRLYYYVELVLKADKL